MSEMVDRDQEHLRLLKAGYYVMAGMTCFFSLFALLYVGIGGFMASGVLATGSDRKNDPRIAGMIFLGIGIAFLFLGLASSALYFVAARSLASRRRRTFCLVMAGLTCFFVPWGTVIGFCTILVLIRPEVKMLFETTSQSRAPI